MEIDACADGIGAVLMQKGQPIAFLSKALDEKHKHLSIYEKVLGIDYGSGKVETLSTKTKIYYFDRPQILSLSPGIEPAF